MASIGEPSFPSQVLAGSAEEDVDTDTALGALKCRAHRHSAMISLAFIMPHNVHPTWAQRTTANTLPVLKASSSFCLSLAKYAARARPRSAALVAALFTGGASAAGRRCSACCLMWASQKSWPSLGHFVPQAVPFFETPWQHPVYTRTSTAMAADTGRRCSACCLMWA